MKPQLEPIVLPGQDTSFRYFTLEVPGFVSYWHYHPELELTYIHSGQGLRFVGDHIAAFRAGDLVLLGENLPHNWASASEDSGEEHIAYVLQFSKDLFQSFPECQTLLKLFTTAQRGLHFHQPDPALLQQMEILSSLPPLTRLTTLLDILHQLTLDTNYQLLSSIAYNEKDTYSNHRSRISEVISYIIQHCEQPLSLDQLARFCGMTPPSFCRWFKQSVGHPFVTYLNTMRIERACQYLLQTDWQVAQIAYRSGFESVSHFNRTFKQFKKLSPTQYREKWSGV